MGKNGLFGQATSNNMGPLEGLMSFALGTEKKSFKKNPTNSLVLILTFVFGFVLLGPLSCLAQSASTETPSNGPTLSPSAVSGTTPNAAPANSTNTPGSPTATSNGLSPSQSNAKSEPTSQEISKVTKPISTVSYPRWTDLTAKQQLALRPLLDLWAEMSEIQKRKWLAVSANFSELNIKDQEKLQARMSQWSVLSPQQRAQARVIFAQVQQYQGDERLNKWQEYQALDPDKKSQLAQNLSVMPNSAAISPKPKAVGSSSNTVYLPAHQPSPLRLQVDQIASKTLLPPKQSRPAP